MFCAKKVTKLPDLTVLYSNSEPIKFLRLCTFNPMLELTFQSETLDLASVLYINRPSNIFKKPSSQIKNEKCKYRHYYSTTRLGQVLSQYDLHSHVFFIISTLCRFDNLPCIAVCTGIYLDLMKM